VLFNEPKLLKSSRFGVVFHPEEEGFSALQRAEIAEIEHLTLTPYIRYRFSALQRAEIAEMQIRATMTGMIGKFQCSSTSRNC